MTRPIGFLLLLALAACGGREETATTDEAVGGAGTTGTATTTDPMTGTTAGTTGTTGTTAGGDVSLEGTTLEGDLDQVINNQGSLTEIAPSVAVPLIGRIQQRLAATDNGDLKDIAEQLGELRQQLQGTNTEGKQIGETLNELADKVAKFANSEDPAAEGARPRLARLSGALSTAGKRLAGTEGGN